MMTSGLRPRRKDGEADDVEFKVDTDVFSGPMDLLLYLVKKHEVDVTEVPIARIAAEFVAYLDVLEDLAIDQVGEFVEPASSSARRPANSPRR